jgi:hypothetical protein
MNFPLDIRFRIIAIASQLTVRDATGVLLCYVKQKAFRLKEDVVVFGDEAQARPLYRIQADRVLDISAQYAITEAGTGRPLGAVRRRGMRSFWRAHYEVEREGKPLFTIQEENPWVKVVDGLVGELPIVGMLAGYLFHPAYRVTTASGEAVLRAVKRPAFWEGRFQVEALSPLQADDERLAVLAIVMLLLLERQRS